MRDVFLKAVLVAVEFDSDARAMFSEVEKISVHRNLPAEVKASRIQLVQLPPEQAFGVGSGVAQLTGALDRSLPQSFPHSPHPKKLRFFDLPTRGR